MSKIRDVDVVWSWGCECMIILLEDFMCDVRACMDGILERSVKQDLCTDIERRAQKPRFMQFLNHF